MDELDCLDDKVKKDLKNCIKFHGHLCPGLIYGYIVSKEAIRLHKVSRSTDEEIVAICENDSCSIDAFQIILGTTAGKGNLIIQDYGKNAYTIINRSSNKAFRFSRKNSYKYKGKHQKEFMELENAFSSGTANKDQRKRQKMLKSLDLLEKPFDDVFHTENADIKIPSYAPLARSVACSICGEMTMETKMTKTSNGQLACIPCSTA